MVPDWFQRRRFQIEFGSRMAPALVFFVFSFLLVWGSRELLTDWPAFFWQAGRLENGALRLASGQWPYLQFYFSDTPGVLLLHWLSQSWGLPGLSWHLAAASLSASIVFHWSAGWRLPERLLLGAMLLAWGISLWNIPHPAWPALAVAMAGIAAGRGSRWLLAGVLFAAAFWLQQQVGALVFLGALFFVGIYREKWAVIAGFLAGIALPILVACFIEPALIRRAVQQIEFLPTWPLRNLPREVIGAPLVTLGLWVLSLYFFRSNKKLRIFSFLAVLAYAGVGWMREERGFLLGCLFLISVVIWVAAPLLAISTAPEKRREFFKLWFPAAGFFLLFSGEFPPFLIFFPLTAYFVLWSIACLLNAYPWLPRWWVYAPAFALLVGGGIHQSRLLFLQAYASRDAIEKLSYGEVRQVSEEVAAIKEFLSSMGATEGSPLLVIPAAPYLYFYTGLTNPTPFDEVSERSLARFPYGALLPEYVRSGGKFLVVQGNPPPFLSAEIQEKFTPALRLLRFTVWKRNEN